MDSITPKHQYPLGYARHANCRLNLQYRLTIQHFNNNLLDPNIVNDFPKGLKTPNLRIADVCCGTGMWLVDVSHVVDESAELHSFDLNLSNLPHAAWIPKIKPHKYNVFDPPPAHLKGTFDIVNLSLAMTFVTDALIGPTIANLVSLLKPNGWLQWTETDPSAPKIYAPTPAARTEYMAQTLPAIWEFLGIPRPTWVPNLDSFFLSDPSLEQGSISCIKSEPDLSLLRVWTEVFFMAPDELIATFERTHASGKTDEGQQKVEKFRRIIDSAWRELVEEGVGYAPDQIRVVGKKKAVAS